MEKVILAVALFYHVADFGLLGVSLARSPLPRACKSITGTFTLGEFEGGSIGHTLRRLEAPIRDIRGQSVGAHMADRRMLSKPRLGPIGWSKAKGRRVAPPS